LTDVLEDVSPFGSTGHDLTKDTNMWGYSMALPGLTGIAWLAIIALVNKKYICDFFS